MMGFNQSTVQSFSAKSGLNHFVAPYPARAPDGPVVIGMYRNGTNVGGLQQNEVEITSQPTTYNFNPVCTVSRLPFPFNERGIRI